MPVNVEVESYTVPPTGLRDLSNNSVEVRTDVIAGWANVLADTHEESALAKLWTSLLCNSFVDGGIDPSTGHLSGYSIQQASWAAAVAKLLDGEATIDPLAETGASAGLAGVQQRRNGDWHAYWAGGCRVMLVEGRRFSEAEFCTDSQPFESPSLNSLEHATLPLNEKSGNLDESSLFVVCDSLSADWVKSHLKEEGLWSGLGGLAGFVSRARLDGNLGTEAVSLLVIDVTIS